MGAARKIEETLEVNKKPKMHIALKLAIAAGSLFILFFVASTINFYVHWINSPIRAEMLAKMERGEVKKPLLWFLL